MKTEKKNTGIKVNAGLKSGGLPPGRNHIGTGLKVRAGIKAGVLVGAKNHARRMLGLN
jgi:hypothetical protein